MNGTPRTWPENAYPTATELADWLEVCTRDERVSHAERSIRDAQDALRCMVSHWGKT